MPEKHMTELSHGSTHL